MSSRYGAHSLTRWINFAVTDNLSQECIIFMLLGKIAVVVQGYLNSHVLNHPGRGLQLLHPRRALSRCQSRHRLWTSRAWPEVVYERASQKVSVAKNPSQKLVVMKTSITSQKRLFSVPRCWNI